MDKGFLLKIFLTSLKYDYFVVIIWIKVIFRGVLWIIKMYIQQKMITIYLKN